MEERHSLTEHIGYNLLGPVMHRWMLALYQHITYLERDDTVFLYCARAGVRINELYKIFSKNMPDNDSVKSDIFWISRLAIAKGSFGKDKSTEKSIQTLSKEYEHNSIKELLQGLLRHNPNRIEKLQLDDSALNKAGSQFKNWLGEQGENQDIVKQYLYDCSAALDVYIRSLTQGKKRVVLIDSGWQGSSQSLLSAGWDDLTWLGLYFGRILMPGHDTSIVPNVIGLMFEANEYSANIPESAFVRHRHIIESVLEPNGQSVEEIMAPPFLDIANRLIATNINEEISTQNDSLYIHIKKYIEDHAQSSISQIISQHQRVMPQLAKIIITPTREEALSLMCKDRSADFGKSLLVPVLAKPDSFKPDEKDFRIRSALWQEGQIAIEYEGKIAIEMQHRINNLMSDAAYFDPISHQSSNKIALISEADESDPKVAIITRTKNRPLLLKRAAESVANQTFSNYIWVVVNDGGDEDAVREVIDACAVDMRRIKLLSHTVSVGMEAASNSGIRVCSSDYLVIHDDDDSWHPNFLESTISFLDSQNGGRYGGVVTQSLYVSEEVRGERVIEHGRYPYQEWAKNVQLSEMACGNFFPPIAFVYKRSVWENVGGYNEALPVLGDWYFNLEFLLEADIGMILKPLAYYHHRDRGDSKSGLYSNSVIGGQSKHEEFAAIARNQFLRKHAGKTTAALTVALGYFSIDIRNRIQHGFKPSEQRSPTDSDEKATSLIDLYWSISQINFILCQKTISDKHMLSFLKKETHKFLPTNSKWPEVLSIIKELNLDIQPPDNFEEIVYLRQNPDVAEVVQQGLLKSGYMHYLMYGRAEGRMRPMAN